MRDRHGKKLLCVLLVVASCSSDEASESGRGSEALTDGGADGSNSGACADSFLRLYAAVESDAACLDTNVAPMAVCARTTGISPAVQCVERADGARGWLRHAGELELASGFRSCSDALPLHEAPAPCAFASCADPPTSLCSPEDTADQFRCGERTSARDATCCLRRTCTETDECDASQVCEPIGTISAQYCYPIEAGCECEGTTGGPTIRYCVQGS